MCGNFLSIRTLLLMVHNDEDSTNVGKSSEFGKNDFGASEFFTNSQDWHYYYYCQLGIPVYL